jgi:ketosteroid isomerase-like protein
MPHAPVAVLAIILATLPAVGCGPSESPAAAGNTARTAAFDMAAIRRSIEEKNRRFTNAHVTGDSVAMVDIFAQDARVLPPNADPVIGYPAIEALTAQYLQFGITEFREETTAFYGNEDILIDEGSYVLVYGKDNTTERGKYLNVWRREGDEWKIYSNMWNANAPAPPAH